MSPRAETLRRVTELWEILLGHASFGPDDPFFDVGGDSRRGVELTLILAEEFECSVTTADVFQHPTPRSLAGFLDTLLGLSAPAGRERGGTGPAAATRQAPPVTAPGPADPGIPLRAADVAVIGMAGR